MTSSSIRYVLGSAWLNTEADKKVCLRLAYVFCRLLIFFKINFFKNITSGIPSKCQTVCIQIRPGVLSGLIWVQTICKGYQQTTLLAYSPSNGTLFFGNNIKSKMGILNLIRKIYFNQKTLIKNIFLKFVYVFINAVIEWNFNILNVLMQITFPSCTLSDMDQ